VVAADRPPTPLGEIIRRQRELSKLSMRQVAKTVGISNPYLSQIERGLREPSEKVLDAIAGSLEMTTDALYAEAGYTSADDDGQPDPAPVIEAIGEDPALTGRQRQALIEVYEAFTARNGSPRRPRRGRGRG